MQRLFLKRLLVIPWVVSLLFLSFMVSPNVAFARVSAAPGFGFSISPTQGAPGTVITATGSSWTQGETVDISLSPSTTILVSVVASLSEGMFTATFTVPANAAAGQQFVNADGRTGNETAQAPFTVLSSPAPTIDLQTLDIHSLQPLVAGTNPTLRADIRNNGSVASGNFNIRWIADGTIFDGGHYSIPAGAVDTHDHIWSNITPGQHTLTFIANFGHGIPETDYSNNQVTFTFTVASSGPLGGTWISPANGFTVTGNSLHFAAHAYGGAGVSYVNFTATSASNAWFVACKVVNPTPVTADIYTCDWPLKDGSGQTVPSGAIKVSFDVYDKAGQRILSPNGVRTGIVKLVGRLDIPSTGKIFNLFLDAPSDEAWFPKYYDKSNVLQTRPPRGTHSGIDISNNVADCQPSSPVYAAAPGKVIWAGWAGAGFGWSVVVSHGYGLSNNGHYTYTLYGHMGTFGTTKQASKECLKVQVGDSVNTTTIVGYQGSSGLAKKATHIHFMIFVGNQNVTVLASPYDFVNKDSTYPASPDLYTCMQLTLGDPSPLFSVAKGQNMC